jgi:DNA-binding ferritin-like protein
VFSEADRVDDQATADLANDRARAHEKAAWMLRSYLE